MLKPRLLKQHLEFLRLIDGLVRVKVVGLPAHQVRLKRHLAAASLLVPVHDLVEVRHRDLQPPTRLQQARPVFHD